MLSAIFTLFFNLPMLYVLLGLGTLAGVIFLVTGPAGLLKVVLDARAWIAVAILVLGVALWHSADTISTQKDEITTLSIAKQAGSDSQAVVTDVGKKKAERTQQDTKLQDVIDHAEDGSKVDALMDEIESERCSDAGSVSDTECVQFLEGK